LTAQALLALLQHRYILLILCKCHLKFPSKKLLKTSFANYQAMALDKRQLPVIQHDI